MANDTQNKPGNKAPALKAQDKAPAKDAAAKPDPEKPGAADKAPAPKTQDKPPAKDAAAKHTPEKPGAADKALNSKAQDKVPAPKTQDKPPAAKKIVPFDKNKTVQEDKKAAEKKAAAKEVAEKKAAAEKAAAEKAEAEKAAEKVRLEKELREKFNIPKSSKPVEPWIAPEEETVVRITHAELHSFKDHPFHVDKDSKFLALAASIRARGVTQPAIVRPREAGGFEIISGHRRDAGSIEAGVPYTPCIIRKLNDDQAIQQMVEDNINHRDIGTIELAKALNMQLESLKHQGAADSLQKGEVISAEDVGKRSNQIVAERNSMSVKQVQRHINLLRLGPALQEMVDGKHMTVDGKEKVIKIGFTPAVELSAIKDEKLQDYIAIAIEGQQSAPSLSQAQRMKQLFEQKALTPDVIDGILTEEKKEVDRVILSTEELSQYFGKDKPPREMKEKIMELLADMKDKEQAISVPERKSTPEK